jgi:hypothetical protein
LLQSHECYCDELLQTPLFADDTNFFISNKNVETLFTDMNTELAKITIWFKANKLPLNIKKTKCMLFHSASKRRLIPSVLPQLQIDNDVIERETVTKFLGVLIDENLSWKKRIECVTNKVSKSIGILYRTRIIIGKKNLAKLYFAFVQSYINYACIAWASTNKTKLEPLLRRQKQAVRAINFKDRRTHTSELFLDIKALTIFKLNLYNTLCLIYKSINKTCPPAFHNLATKKPPSKYNLRREGLLYEPLCKTKFSQFSINYRGPHLWNKLIIDRNDISHCKNFYIFKYKLKEYILSLEAVEEFF